jgi:NADH:ubiquinone oxidoreductase subunit F (NADH-binding)
VSRYAPTLPGAPGALADGAPPLAPGASGLPRLLAGIPARGTLPLREHLALHGPPPAVEGRGWRRHDAAGLVEEVERAGLRGRGGAAFPTAAKLRAVVDAARGGLAGRLGAPGARPLVVVNGAESEPASAKDRTLLRALPHLVLDGAALAAAAVGAREVLLGVCASSRSALDGVARALEERASVRGGAGDGGVRFELHAVPARYVAGQESALVSFLSGGSALPTFTPPRPFARGVHGRPTLVCNVETLAHLALVGRYGAAWFRELGTPEQPGSALLTLSGPLAHPGVYEVELGSPLAALLDAAGGLRAPARAVLIGGYGGTWVDGARLEELALSDRDLAPFGATLGAGVVAMLSADACPVAELAHLTRWLAGESARQCGPCLFGLDALAAVFEGLALGGAPARRGVRRVRGAGGGSGIHGRGGGAGRSVPLAAAPERLRALSALVRGRGACGHPDGAARLVESALEVFAEELDAHARHGPCAACAEPPELPLPRVAGTPPTALRSPSPLASAAR